MASFVTPSSMRCSLSTTRSRRVELAPVRRGDELLESFYERAARKLDAVMQLLERAQEARRSGEEEQP
ncbi:MAG: hypothetical protein ACRDWD_15540 [Acidimicrobiia bacterium]